MILYLIALQFCESITNDNVEVSKNRCYRCLIIKPTSNKETGINFEIIKARMSTGIINNNDGSLINDGIFKSTPTMIKKIGIKNPYPNESSVCTNSSSGFSKDTTTPLRMRLVYIRHTLQVQLIE